MTFNGDFHVHTCLSPCADLAMVPNVLAARFEKAGVEWIAVTDHNSCRNVRVFDKVMKAHGIKILAGIEVQTVEEVHVLIYLKSVEVAERFSDEIKEHLPNVENDPERFGYQLLVDENDNFIGMENAMLSASTNLTLDELWLMAKRYDGLFVYAHVDRRFGVMKQLGFIPNSPSFDAVEASGTVHIDCTVLKSSDAHFLSQVERPRVKIKVNSRTFEEFRDALIKREVWDI